MAPHQSPIDATTSGVKALPARIPTTGRASSRTGAGIIQRPPDTATRATAASEPSVQGSGAPIR